MLLRAVEWAKRSQSKPLQFLWVRAQNTHCNPKDIGRTPETFDEQLEHFLQLHDQQTGGIPGLFPAFIGLRVRFTEKIKISPKVIVLTHFTSVIVGLELHPADVSVLEQDCSFECRLMCLPKVFFLQVDGATWQIEGLPVGVYDILYILLKEFGN